MVRRLPKHAVRLMLLTVAIGLDPYRHMAAQCVATVVYPPTGNTIVEPHHALQISDPAREQTATFDLYWGGALVSLKYKGEEYVGQGSTFTTGGLVQLATFGPSANNAFYNPTQAGGNPYYPSAVAGAACNSSGQLGVWTPMLDYNHGDSGFAPTVAVFNGQQETPTLYQVNPPHNSAFAPYVLYMFASWVATGGEPQYYLRLQERLTNVSTENYTWDFDFAAYLDYSRFNVEAQYPAITAVPNCTKDNFCTDASTELPLIVGYYSQQADTDGVAIGIGKGQSIETGFWWVHSTAAGDVHLIFNNVTLPGGQQKLFAYYIMPGPFANAQTFMQTHN